jgi:hypothetical protein
MPDYTPKYGNCYTFNAQENSARDSNVPRVASLTGRDYGKTCFLPPSFLFFFPARVPLGPGGYRDYGKISLLTPSYVKLLRTYYPKLGPEKCGLGSGSGFTPRARAFAGLAWPGLAWPGGQARGLACGLSLKTRPPRAWAWARSGPTQSNYTPRSRIA